MAILAFVIFIFTTVIFTTVTAPKSSETKYDVKRKEYRKSTGGVMQYFTAQSPNPRIANLINLISKLDKPDYGGKGKKNSDVLRVLRRQQLTWNEVYNAAGHPSYRAYSDFIVYRDWTFPRILKMNWNGTPITGTDSTSTTTAGTT
ncbi:hypothetical protein O0L34_g4520 [Tuta absoluta]|nr:hypothetical protein O0L34_g4520 [Tuta absoluta]